MLNLRKACLYIAAAALLALAVGLVIGNVSIWRPAAVILTVGVAIGLGSIPTLKGYQFTMWIIAAVTTAMIYPSAFQKWGDFNLRDKWLILIIIQIVMFGMGLQMSLHDFAGVAKNPRGVIVGIVCHFTVMPLVGLALVKIFGFEPEIAAGVILIGSCSSGLASNVMAYIAKSNLVLSVTVTAITTMVAPLMTPLWMKLLAGTMIEVKVFDMMMEIIKIVLVPIGAALLHDYLKHSSAKGRKVVLSLAGFGTVWLVVLALGFWNFLKASFPAKELFGIGIPGSQPWFKILGSDILHIISIPGFLLSAFVIGVVYHCLTLRFKRLDSWMPVASMFGIVYFTTVTTAAGRENLLKIGLLLFLAAAIHNAAGYFFGYWLSRATGMDKNSARSVAFEVGLQNGGMATGIANSMDKLATVGLAAAIFSPWMNISGSILANYWKKHPVDDGSQISEPTK